MNSQTVQEGLQQALIVSASKVEVVPGHNPRTHFGDQAMLELRASVKELGGIFQSLLVRPHPEKEGIYQLAAGERRLRAVRAELGEEWPVPVTVREMTDVEMKAIAIIENVGREEMSYANQAESANVVLMANKGDQAETARQLGWSVSMLRCRLALLHATKEVREALTKKEILLGHAELLAGLQQDKQNEILPKLIEHKISVAELKRQIGAMARELAAAIFDKAECAGCPSNSSIQASFFSEAVEDGRCTKGTCYDAKTEGRVVEIQREQQGNVSRVEVLRLDSKVKTIKIVVEGSTGVGVEQAKACRGCANFGATVSALPGQEGEVEGSICFDEGCHAEKVKAHKGVLAKAQREAAKAAKQAADAGASPQAVQSAATTAHREAVRGADKASTSGVSTRIKEYRLQVWRNAATAKVKANPEEAMRLLVGIACFGHLRDASGSDLSSGFAKLAGVDARGMSNITCCATALKQMDGALQSRMLSGVVGSVMQKCDESFLVECLDFLSVDLGESWSVQDEKFLALLTKAEIYAACEEIGLVRFMGKEGFAAACSGKKDAMISLLCKVEGFNYEGKVPACMRWVNSKARVVLCEDNSEVEADSAAGAESALEAEESAAG